MASNVALFSPIVEKNYQIVNGILSATKKQFRRIAIVFLSVGVIAACVYAMLVGTDLSRNMVWFVLMMAILPQAVNLFFISTYRVLLQAQQKEYVISGSTALTIGAGHITNIFLINQGVSMWTIRFTTMVFALLNCYLIAAYTKRVNRFIDLDAAERGDLIIGTKDVMVQKVTGVVYTSLPMVFLSILPKGGSMVASVYGVYNSVFVMLKAMLHAAIDAPRLGLGHMISEKDKDKTWEVFTLYEYVSVGMVFVFMVTACALIMPFIKLYTRDVTDINYNDSVIAVLMVLISSIEILHIPSGHHINMAGEFRVSKRFQLVACVTLILSMFLFGTIFGVYGMLGALLLVAIMLTVLEVGYVHCFYYKKKIYDYLTLLIPFFLLGIILSFLEANICRKIDGVRYFLMTGSIVFFLNLLLTVLLLYVTNQTNFISLLMRIKQIMGIQPSSKQKGGK